MAWLHRFIWITLPGSLLALDRRVTSGRLSSSMQRFGKYMMYDRHPTVLLFFLSLLAGGEYLYLPSVWPQLGPLQKVMGAIAIICPYAFLYLSAAADPGYITPANHQEQMAQYPYDHAIFHPGAHCRTCRLLKPARSKHCSICKRCVARADHHCIFINSCVGQGNLHWFILLLLSTAVLCSYGTYLGLSLLSAKMKGRDPDFSIWPPSARSYDWSGYFIVWTWGLQDDVGMGSVTILTFLISPLVWGLFLYNMYMIYAGTTTNESMKWSDWKLEIDDGYAFRRRMPQDRQKDLRFEPAWTRWPVSTGQILVRTESGYPPRSDSQNHPGVGEWVRVRSLRSVDNLYDLGFWDNLREVFWPRYRVSGGAWSSVPVSEWAVGNGRKGRF
ncbi:palmitoyltransferase swf1 [Cytospora paraplurivora]|uniref:Palmitoyltransferase n=1 Tax=Cytospora paraplurivora TaxID=2898453 RepID=A0AAN9UF80_9PEZI